MKPLVEQVKGKYEGKVSVVYVDVDGNEGSAKAGEYGVQSLPTLVFLKKDGSVANKIMGVVDIATIEQNIENIIN